MSGSENVLDPYLKSSANVHVVQVDESAGEISGSIEALKEFPPII